MGWTRTRQSSTPCSCPHSRRKSSTLSSHQTGVQPSSDIRAESSSNGCASHRRISTSQQSSSPRTWRRSFGCGVFCCRGRCDVSWRSRQLWSMIYVTKDVPGRRSSTPHRAHPRGNLCKRSHYVCSNIRAVHVLPLLARRVSTA